MAIFKFELGDVVKDSITGFKGTITCRAEHFNGCIRYCFEGSKMKDDGSRLQAWEDEERLELVKAKNKKAPKKRPGGSRPAPPSISNPR